jgi:hypothetical protein
MKTKKEFANIYINNITNELFISNKPYSTNTEANNGIFHGIGIQKIKCIKIKTKVL